MAKKKEPIYQKFMMDAEGNYSGEKDVFTYYDSFSELMKAVREHYKNGYTSINVYIRGIYGRKSIKRNSD